MQSKSLKLVDKRNLMRFLQFAFDLAAKTVGTLLYLFLISDWYFRMENYRSTMRSPICQVGGR